MSLNKSLDKLIIKNDEMSAKILTNSYFKKTKILEDNLRYKFP